MPDADMKQDEDDGIRELKPVQFFGNDGSGAFGVDKGMDFRPGITREQDEETVDPITHEFQAEPGEPGVPDDEPEFEEEPMSLLDDAPPVDEDDLATQAEDAIAEAEALLADVPTTAEPEEEITAPEAQTAEE